MPDVNNAFYDTLGDTWFEGDLHAVALLRAESSIKVRYVLQSLERAGIGPGSRILDVACGGGLVAFPIAEAGYSITGIDLAAGAIDAARARVDGLPLDFRIADAYATGEPDASFDAVLLMDMLEHVDRPSDVIAEAARVVRPGGAVIFHTFNRTPLSWALAIHGMKVVARDTPPHVHTYDLFVKPEELREMAFTHGLRVMDMQGVRVNVDWPFWWSILHRRVHPGFGFTYTKSKAAGYAGYAIRERP